jgi:hypothetical protein
MMNTIQNAYNLFVVGIYLHLIMFLLLFLLVNYLIQFFCKILVNIIRILTPIFFNCLI